MNNTPQPFEASKLVLLTIMLSLGIFMNVLDSSIANVAIPTIAGNLAVSPNQGTWVITSFAVSTAIVIPLTGWLAKQFGEVRLFVISTLLFTITSVLCGLAPNLQMLVTSRVLQGAVAGPMIPLSQSLLLANYPEEKKGFATALWAMTAVIAPILGPILGGWITDNYSWPWIFYINVPVGFLSAYFTWNLLRDRETKITKQPVDKVGLALLILGVGCLQILLDNGKDLDWFHSNVIITLTIISFVSLSFFIVWELTEANPIVDLKLFTLRNFAIGTIALSLGYLLFFGNVVIFPLWLQTQMDYTPTWAGLATAPLGILSFLLTPIIGRNLNKVDLRLLVSIGFIVFAISSFWYASFNTNVSFNQLIMPRLFQGLGVACFFPPLIAIIFSNLPPERIASASGLSNFLRILGGGFGTSISVTLWDHRESIHHSQLIDKITTANPDLNSLLTQLHHLGISTLSGFAIMAKLITNQAYMLATDDFFWISGWVFLGLLALIWFARGPFLSTGGKTVAME